MEVIDKVYAISTEVNSLEDILHWANQADDLSLSEEAIRKIIRCRNYLDQKLASGDKVYYGINTGFGYLQKIKIEEDKVTQLQHNLILSHACGVGEEVNLEIIKYMMLLKIKSLASGHSGVKIETVERLMAMIKHKMYPVIYSQGSLGASGDLCPLSHMVLPLIGEGMVYFNGQKMTSKEALGLMGWLPLNLAAKEGLALINGTQFMLAHGLYVLNKAKKLIQWADWISALSVEAYEASTEPFHALIHQVRNQAGQIKVAEKILRLLSGSDIFHKKNNQVQDPYSFRCIPQVHGASLDTFHHVWSVMEREINAVTDNPLIFPDEDLILSGGNFHGQPLAMSFDYLAIALSELGNISERRIFQLLSGQHQLPLFLVHNPGLNSGLMIAQYTAASLVSENKQLCTPASVDSIVSSNGQEDHVSMGANAATQCKKVVENLEKILAIELLTACQAFSFRRPSVSSEKIEKVYSDFRKKVPFNAEDRLLHDDIVKSIEFISTYDLPSV